MNNNLSPKYNSATFKTKGAAAKIKSRVLLVFSVLIFNSASALGQTNLELIEQQIEKAENSLKTTEKFIEQLLWRDVPANQAETQEVKARAAQDATELSTLATIVDSSQARLLQSKNQLERSNRILITSQQELQQAKKEIDNLEKQTRLSLDSLAKQAVNIEQLEVETRTVNASIDESTPELERLKSILETAYQQSQQREQQTQQLRQSEAEFEQTLARKQEKISAQTSALLDLRKQLQALKTKMLNEQDDWAKVGAQIATRDSKREQLETKLGDNSRLTREAIQELEVLKGELQKAKSATTKKRDKLVASKSNIALAKRALKDSQQQLRRAQADLKNDQSAEGRELAVQNKITSDIQANNLITSQLKKNKADVLIEIRQLEKLLEIKNQSLAPLREKTEQLRRQQQETAEQQGAEQRKFDHASTRLIATEQRYQNIATEVQAPRQSIRNETGQ